MGRRKTTSQFIAEAKAIHGDKYDYSNTKYLGATQKLQIACPTHGTFYQLPHAHTSGQGCPLCYHKVLGVANYDGNSDDNTIIKHKWHSMINRCYNPKATSRRPTYQECSVCDEWLTFSNFKKWFEDPTNGYQEGYHLDKDILVKGNCEYSPETCCFVPNEINVLLTKRQRQRGKYPIGVTYVRGLYIANVNMDSHQVRIGGYHSPEDAFQAYKIAKEQYIKELAEKYFQEGKITEKVYDALMKYEVEITD
jgi:hypothetical protein